MISLNFVKYLIGILFLCLTILGFTAYSYNFRTKKFAHSYLLLTYSFLVIISFTLFYTKQAIEEYREAKLDIRNAGQVYYYLNVISAVVSFITAFVLSSRILKFLNSLEVIKKFIFFQIKDSYIYSSVGTITLKTIAFHVIVEIVFVLRQTRDEPEKSLFWTLYTILPWIIAHTTANCLFGFLIINKLLIQALDKVLEDIAKEVNFMQTKLQMNLQKPYYRMRRFCDLADKLDVLAIKYQEIEERTMEFMNITAAPFLCSLICNLFGITSGLFSQYQAIADALINEDSYDIFEVLTSSVFLIISVVEIILISHFSNDSLEVAQHTGHILQRMNLLNADVRFKRSVEEFSLLTLVKKFKIQPWGLLEINVALLHDVLSAVTSFLLILIQSDLALRFSLK